MTNKQKLKKLYARLDEIEAYERCLGKMSFDMECCAPEEGIAPAGQDMALIGKQLFKLTHASGYTKLICELHENSDGLSDIQKKTIEHLYDRYSKVKNQTPEFAYEADMVAANAYGDWLKAKKNSDFSIFRDTFEKTIDITRRAIDLRDQKYPTYYTACLDDCEKGGSEEQLDAFFNALKKRLVPLMKRIVAEGKPIRSDFMSRPVSVPMQEKCSEYMLEVEGLRKSALVLMTTEHPFTTSFGYHDVRVTTHYYENAFISGIFSTLHEGGHALFMQNEPEALHAEHCADAMSNGMHETISRFYENLIGRSEEFVNFVYPMLRENCGGILDDVSPRELYEAINIAEPSLIRTEADELTYCLHIIVRYELEKAFVNGEISVDEVPALWNKKYREYLGIDVPDDARGCLQDVHWTMSFGYFPSYALGNAYGAQILNTMQKDFDVFEAVARGDLKLILDWLKEKVFSIASLTTPDEWIRAITGESLNPDYYLDYLEKKFTALYELKD